MNRWLSPALTSTILLVLGGVILYLLGRWDQSIDTQWELHRAAVDRALEDGQRARAREDSLRDLQLRAEARADSAEHQAQLQAAAIVELQTDVEREVEISVASSIADILPKLRMRPIAPDLYGTDSSGVRFLEKLRIESLKALLVPPLQEYVHTLGIEIAELRNSVIWANTRADSAGARAARFEDLLREGRDLGECHLDPLGLIPCPSRGVVLVLGITAGTAGAVLITGS